MHACDIRQYLIRQYMFCTISSNITLANILSYTVLEIFCLIHFRANHVPNYIKPPLT